MIWFSIIWIQFSYFSSSIFNCATLNSGISVLTSVNLIVYYTTDWNWLQNVAHTKIVYTKNHSLISSQNIKFTTRKKIIKLFAWIISLLRLWTVQSLCALYETLYETIIFEMNKLNSNFNNIFIISIWKKKKKLSST